MLRISEPYPLYLEKLVRAVYHCERFEMNGIMDADYFGIYPYHAALLIIAPKYYKAQGNRGRSEKYWEPIDSFMNKYGDAFLNSSVEKFDDELIDAFVNDLEALVTRYYRCLPPKKIRSKKQ